MLSSSSLPACSFQGTPHLHAAAVPPGRANREIELDVTYITPIPTPIAVSVSRYILDTAIRRYIADTVSRGIEEKEKFN
jgi:hypothetical protein